ncbi:hypothetical protein AB0M43_37350 [Longispora sp. NPDC051575]|uniref:hypothetical protein n=1 Tax=Longispora sp. NPDC051575 TaxID=3154943 RepID=UPI00341A42AE
MKLIEALADTTLPADPPERALVYLNPATVGKFVVVAHDDGHVIMMGPAGQAGVLTWIVNRRFPSRADALDYLDTL